LRDRFGISADSAKVGHAKQKNALYDLVVIHRYIEGERAVARPGGGALRDGTREGRISFIETGGGKMLR